MFIYSIIYKVNNFNFGFVAKNFGQKAKYISRKESVSRNIEIGSSYKLGDFLLSIDIGRYIKEEWYYQIGIEYSYKILSFSNLRASTMCLTK